MLFAIETLNKDGAGHDDVEFPSDVQPGPPDPDGQVPAPLRDLIRVHRLLPVQLLGPVRRQYGVGGTWNIQCGILTTDGLRVAVNVLLALTLTFQYDSH